LGVEGCWQRMVVGPVPLDYVYLNHFSKMIYLSRVCCTIYCNEHKTADRNFFETPEKLSVYPTQLNDKGAL
jgi:hypothetical protein